MSDQDVFSDTPPPSTPSGVDDLLAAIKNEQGEQKYKTVEDAIKGAAASQAFIATLLNEKREVEAREAELKEALKKQNNIDEVLKKLAAEKETGKNDHSTSGLSAEAVAELVRKELAGAKQKDQYEKNLADVQNSLSKKFGEKTKEAVAKKAAELGTTPQKLGELSAENPSLVLALFEAQRVAPTIVTPSSVNLPHNPPSVAVERPAKSLLLGATSNEQKEFMKKVQEDVFKRFNVEK